MDNSGIVYDPPHGQAMNSIHMTALKGSTPSSQDFKAHNINGQSVNSYYLSDDALDGDNLSGGTFKGHNTDNRVVNGHTDSGETINSHNPGVETMRGHTFGGVTAEGAGENGQSPIAICGMAFRLPGGLSTSQQLWDFLLNKGDARSQVPESRYNVSAFHDPTGKPGSVISEHGYFLDEDIGRLDTSFFTMARMEVERLDPQQRLMLETARECFEDSGVTDWRGKRVGCYMGSLFEDWCEMFARETQNWGRYRITGFGDFALSNRVSYEMDLQGPSMTIRTACSSSLVALHEACAGILRGDCKSALVGGANLIMTPGSTTSMTEQNVLSKDGSCNTFSADANGYARGEAITAIYIKKLDDALRDGNPVRAVIRGTSTNHDGKTPGMTVPSSDAQEALIRRSYQTAGITEISRTGFVECHGTGTPIGDPIEVKAVGRVFGERGVYIGSVKPNLGHTEGASGLLSVIKTVLALENRTIPPNIKFQRPNPAISFESAKLTVPVEPTPWPSDRLERASVNSFGVGGTNAHVIIDSAASFNASTILKQGTSDPQLLLFSANSRKSLTRMIEDYRVLIDTNPECIGDLAYTLANKREHLPHRSFAIASKGSLGPAQTINKLAQPPTVIMTFTGQGSQWPQMGRELLDLNPAFSNSIRCMDKYLQEMHDYPLGWRIEEELRRTRDKGRLNAAEFSQPLCAAIQIALVDTFASLGVQPSAVVGHSSGEIAAAYAAGALTREEAIANAIHRGAVANTQKRPGAMAAIGMGWEETTHYLSQNVTIACDNSPSSVTISGDVDAVEAVVANIRKSQPGLLARKLQVDKAYHSCHMVEVGERYCSLIESTASKRRSTKLFFSSVTGRLLEPNTLSSRYWQQNLESPVLFNSAVSSILQHPIGKNAVFLEIGPHSALAGPLRQILTHESSTASYVSAMVRNQNCLESLLAAMGKLHTLQVPIDLQTLIPTGSCLSDLPRYPWDHEECYWYESRLSKEYRQRQYPLHDLLGSRILETTDFELSWRNLFHLDSAAWVRDHKVGDDIIFPFAGYIAMIGEAARQICGKYGTYRLRHVIVSTALVLTEGSPTEMITTLRRQRLTDTLDSAWWEFNVASHNGHAWTKHCTGLVMAQNESLGSYKSLGTLPRKTDPRKWFETLRRAGLDLGPAFRNLKDISVGTTTKRATAKVLNQTHEEARGYHLHPTIIDSAIQLLGIAFTNGESRKHQNRLPISCDTINISHTLSNLTVDAATKFTGGSVVGEIHGTADGVTILDMSGLRLSTIDNSDVTDPSDMHATARLTWSPDIDFMDVRQLITLSSDRSMHMPSLEELSHLCLLYSHRSLAGMTTERPHMRRFHQWIDNQLESFETSSIQNLSTEAIIEKIDHLSHSLAETPASSAAIALQKVCRNTGALFSGQLPSWEAVLDSETVARLYDFISHYDCSLFMQHLGHYKPNLRVLEISPWKSCPSSDILENLKTLEGRALYTRYTFASKGFASAHEGSAKLSNIEYATLNIDQDPLEQGFEGHQYDLIVASNVFHTTSSIGASLGNIKKLLHPNGLLLLHELCPTLKWINYVFGTHPAWWCGLADGRHNEPYVDTKRWQKELVATGYEGTEAVLLDSKEPFQLNAMIVVKPATIGHPTRSISLLCADRTSDPGPMLQELVSQGYNVSRCTVDDQPPPDQDIIALLDRKEPFFENLDADRFESFKKFLNKVENSGILWVTQHSQVRCKDPRYSQIIGFARTVRSELMIDFATCEVDKIDVSASKVLQVLEKFQRRGTDDSLEPDFEYSVYDGAIHVGRFYPFTLSNELLTSELNDRAVLDVEVPGRLSTLHWAQRSAPPSLQPDEVEVEMYSVSLNFRDVLVAMKIVELPERVLGLEGAGVVRRLGSQVKTLRVGDRVAMIERGVFSSVVTTLEILCVKLPDDLDFNEASTMFFPYVTAMHSLMTIGGLERGQSVLIHSACGGVGLAAVQLAQMIEAEIYVSVGTAEKVEHVVETFRIPRERIFHSRDDSFVEGVMRATQGKGVDVVLNSPSGELLHATWRCVGAFGKMIEIGKRDLIGFGKLDMNPFLANRSYCCVDVDAFREKPIILHRALNSVLELYQEKRISPIRPTKVFDGASTCEAFRYMQRGQHIGRICISIRETPDKTSLSGNVVSRQKAPELHNSASYLLVGGLGGLGRAVSLWMVEHGARHLIYLSRNAGVNSENALFVEELNSLGCHVQLVRGSVTDPAIVEKAVREAAKPVRGMLQMSMVLRDENFSKMTLDQWNAANFPKVGGTWNLHNAAVSASLDLDFFVLFSSLSGIVGQPGQANYAAGNTFLDAFVQYRNTLGLCASAIDIGAVGDIGYLSGNPEMMQKMTATGFKLLGEQEILDALAVAIAPERLGNVECETQGSRFVDLNNFVLGLALTSPLHGSANRIVWKNDRRMAIYHNTASSDVDAAAASTSLKSYIAGAKSDISMLKNADAAAFFASEIGKRLFSLLMKPAEDLNTALSLVDLGMDSLVGIELCTWWKQAFGFKISVLEMLGMGTLEALGQHAADGLTKAIQAERLDRDLVNGSG